jgi:hypothetical protein
MNLEQTSWGGYHQASFDQFATFHNILQRDKGTNRNVINLSQLTVVSLAQTSEVAKQPKELVHPGPPLPLKDVDIKPSLPKHYDPKKLSADRYCDIILEGGVCLSGGKAPAHRQRRTNRTSTTTRTT